MTEPHFNINSDLGILCTRCGAHFAGHINSTERILWQFNNHRCQNPEIKFGIKIPFITLTNQKPLKKFWWQKD